MKKNLAVAAILICAGMSLGDAPPAAELPKTLKVKALIDKHALELVKLRDAYSKGVLAADTAYLKDLDSAIQTVAASGANSAEIERVVAARKAAAIALDSDTQRFANGPAQAVATGTYSLWRVIENSGRGKNYWLCADGRAFLANETGYRDRGKWERDKDGTIFIAWGRGKDLVVIANDGQGSSATVYFPKTEDYMQATLVGTSLTGAAAPPKD